MHMHHIRNLPLTYAAMLVAVFFMLPIRPAFAQEGLTLLRSTALERIYEYHASELKWQTVIIDGRPFLRPDSTCSLLRTRPGEPMLPMVSIHLDLQPGQDAAVTLSDTLFSTGRLELPLCPSPSIDPSTGNLFYESAVMAQPLPGFIPARHIESSIGQARDQRILQVSLFPMQYLPADGMIRSLRYAQIRIRLFPAEIHLQRPLIAPSPQSALLSSIKLYLVEEGPYAVTGADLAAAGVALGSIDSQTGQIFNNGIEQAIEIEDGGDGRFDPEDRILFYALFRNGDDEYFNAYSDTNVYWLTWNGSAGIRFSEYAPISSDAFIDAYSDTLHIEKDLYYYAGDTDNDIHRSEKVPGEGWAWILLNKGASANLDFNLPSPAMDQDSLSLRMRLRGTTLDSHSPDHHIKLSLNGTKVYESWFEDRDELLITCKINSSLFRENGNALKLDLLSDLPSQRSQIFLDWFEITYLRSFAAKNNWLSFPALSESGLSVFISGFTDSGIKAWDLKRNRSFLLPAATKLWRDLISVQSHGYFDGNMAKLIRNGKEAGYGFRGHNLWHIDPRNGQLIEFRNFDTYSSTAQADSMAGWIQRLPEGTLVAAAIRDEGSVSMNEAAHLALESLGSSMTRSVGVRDSWAMIGCKGALPGSVPEQLSKSQSGAATADSLLTFVEGGSSYSAIVKPPDDAGRMVVFSSLGVKRPARISLFQPGDLLSGGGGADYLIITHPLFEAPAQRLAAYRAARNGWRTKVVPIEAVYDNFNHGLADPAAIRTFLQHASENWAKPAPGYLLLFGDASWDPKNHLKAANPTEFVPTYGNPVSDSWFGCLDGAGDILPDIHIGRIPVQTVEQAEASVDKIIAYEATPSARWKKEFLFISGGFDFLEQNQFGQQTASLVNQFVVTAPTFGRATMLNKTSAGLEEGEHRQEMLDTINEGVCWVNFIGHAGSRTWDLMFHNVDIEALSNTPRYPFITSMTCHTGRFAEPNQVAFGEHFLMVEDKGAIGFMGTSGWGYSYEDYTFLRKLFPAALKDTVRFLSEIIDKAKVQLWTEAATNPQIRDMIYQYNLLGDPAIRLAVPDRPDLAVQPVDIEVIPEAPSVADSSAQVKLFIHNYGLGTRDSVEVRLVANHPNAGEREIAAAQKLPAIGRLDSLVCSWPLHEMAGALDLVAYIDPRDRISEADEANNVAQRAVNVLSSQIQLLSPPQFALLPPEKTFIRLDGTNRGSAAGNLFNAQIDTSFSFNSAMLLAETISASAAPVFEWRPENLKPSQHYFLRLSDSTSNPGFWQTSSFSTSAAGETGWRQQNGFGFAKAKRLQTHTAETVALESLAFPLYSESAGYSDGNFARIIVGGSPAISPRRGHNVVVVDPGTFTIEATRNFDTYGDSSAANSMASLIESLDNGKIVLAGIMDEGTVSMTERAFRALESIGSAQCRGVSARSSWAIIGRKGAVIGTVPETTVPPKGGSATAVDTLFYFAPHGTLTSPRIGPATAWRSARAEAEVPQLCSLTLSLLGQRRNSSVWDTLRTGLPANYDNNISAISAREYPWLQLVANFTTTDQLSTPRLHAWQVLHDPAPDLAVSPAFLNLSADSVLSGQPVILKLDVFNIGLAGADSVRVTFSEAAPGSDEKLFSRVTLPRSLAADQKLTIDQLYTPTGKPGSRLVTIRVDGDNRINELSESNNTVTARVQVVPDTLQPQIEITFDGRTIVSGDWVAPRPLIQARLIDDSPLSVADTLQLNLLIDGVRVPFNGENSAQLLAPPDTISIALLQHRPLLAKGEHTLEVIFSDASGNINTTRIDFSVAAGLELLRVMNYPNPLQETTDFTFVLTQAADVRIRIYTVNGRLIRLLEAGSVGAGFNRLFWDGRDGDGDPIANGVYLYRVDAVSGGSRAEVIEKCIVMR